MDVTSIAAMAMAMKRMEAAQEANVQLTKQAIQQDASVTQLVAAATQTQQAAATQLLDIVV